MCLKNNFQNTSQQKPEKENKTKQQQTSNKIITEVYQSRCYSSWKPSSKASFSTLLGCMQTDATLLTWTTPNTVGCYMLRPFAHPVA